MARSLRARDGKSIYALFAQLAAEFRFITKIVKIVFKSQEIEEIETNCCPDPGGYLDPYPGFWSPKINNAV